MIHAGKLLTTKQLVRQYNNLCHGVVQQYFRLAVEL